MTAPSRPKRRGQQTLEEQVQQLATIVETSKHLVVYTGAGISTSAGVPDYRGPAGVWTLKAQRKRPSPVAYSQIRPSIAHRGLALLLQAGHVKHVVTQNVDGLHRLSGVPAGKLSELHGNARMERCVKCGREYLRDFATWSVTTAAGSSPASARAKRRRTSQRDPGFEVRSDPSSRVSQSSLARNSYGAQPPSGNGTPSDGTASNATLSDTTVCAVWRNSLNGFAASDTGRRSPSDKKMQRHPLVAFEESSKSLARPGTVQHRSLTASEKPSEETACFYASQHRLSTASEEPSPSEQATRPAVSEHRLSTASEKLLPTANESSTGQTGDNTVTGDGARTCGASGCGGVLRHCVTLFGEPLPDSALRSAEQESARADAALVLGSSLRVAPACTYPADVAARGGKLVIVNLQPTPLDVKADLVIRSTCDQVMALLLDRLNLVHGKSLSRELVACSSLQDSRGSKTNIIEVG